MKDKPNNQMQEENELPQIAANFIEQYTPEDLNVIDDMNPTQIEAYLQAVCLSVLEFAQEITGVEIHVLPGRPDRPKKPQF